MLKKRVLAVRSASPQEPAADMARRFGVSRERIRQILGALRLPTRISVDDRTRADHPGEWKLWGAMVARSPVCDSWRRSFTAFMRDMGPMPSPRHRIGRFRRDRDFKPSNCCWTIRRKGKT